MPNFVSFIWIKDYPVPISFLTTHKGLTLYKNSIFVLFLFGFNV